MTDTLSAATADAGARGLASGAQLAPLADHLAQQISQGVLAAPTTPDGWQNLVSQFSSNSLAPNTTKLSDVGATTAAPGVSPAAATTQPSSSNQSAFANEMKPWAQMASQQTGLDPSVILAQWGNETGWGTSYQWTRNFNPAGIGITSDAVTGEGYGSIAGGVKAYIDFFNGNSRYQAVKDANGAEAQAIALGNSGWAAGKYDNGSGPGSDLMATIPNLTSATGQTTNADPNAKQSTAVGYAQSQIGTNYVWGGEAKGQGFDCSGLVQAAYAAQGVNLPRVAQAQYDATMKVPQGQQLRSGDLVFFGSSNKDITHVGIYVGNGQMIDAPHSGAQVRTESYNWGDFVGATRPSDNSGATMLPQSVQSKVQGNYSQILTQVMSALSSLGGK